MNQLIPDDEARQAIDRLRLRVSGLAAGTRLPPERELAEQLGLNRTRVRRVLAQLAAEGLLERRQGSGTFVAHVPVSVASSLSQELSLRGLSFDLQLLSLERVPAPEWSALSGEVSRLRRTRSIHGERVSYETSHLTGQAVLDAEALGAGSLFTQLALQGLAPVSVTERLTATIADPETARVLACRPGDPLLHIHRIGLTAAGAVVEEVDTLLRADRFAMATSAQETGGLAGLLTYIHTDQDLT